jgi:hypothetical protein
MRRGECVVIFAFQNRNRVPTNTASLVLLAQASIVVALVALGQAAEARSVVNFCNVGSTTLSIVTIGDDSSGGWVVDGWQAIEPGDCRHVDVIYHLKVGFAVDTASGERGMQAYGQAPRGMSTIASSYCVDPAKNFHRRHDTLFGLMECQAGDALARFALDLKQKPSTSMTVRIPAGEGGDVIPFQQPGSRVDSPSAGWATAMRGLAEQQERLGLRIERQEPSPSAAWRPSYIHDLGIVARSETHAVSVAKNSPADKAGIRRGDEFMQIDKIELQSAWHARSLLVRTRPGETRTITFMRDGELRTAEIRLVALPANLAATELHPKQGWLGVEFESSARVVGVIYQVGTPHLELEDDILKIGRSDFDGVDGLARWLARDVDAATVELQVRRHTTGRIVVMTLDKLK